MKYLCVGSGLIKEDLFKDCFDQAVFINAGIEHFYRVNAKKKIWITKPSFFLIRNIKRILSTISLDLKKKKYSGNLLIKN